MKYKAQIIGVVLLLAVFGAMFGIWQFHFKEIFDGYKEDDRLRDALENTLSQLQENFKGYKPELLIEQWQNQVQPWRDAREERAQYFNFGDWYEIDLVPPEARMLKFWYTEETNKILYDLYRKVYERMGGYDRFPNDLRMKLGVAKEEDWSGRNITWAEVEQNLRQLNFGVRLSTLLLESNVSYVRDIVVWPRRIPEIYDDMLGLQTVGLHVTLAAKDLVKFMDNLLQEPRYFTVDSIKLSYPYIGYQVEPQIEVQLLLTQAKYRPPADDKDPALSADLGAPPAPVTDSDGGARPGARREPPQGALGKFWSWFRRVVLYMP